MNCSKQEATATLNRLMRDLDRLGALDRPMPPSVAGHVSYLFTRAESGQGEPVAVRCSDPEGDGWQVWQGDHFTAPGALRRETVGAGPAHMATRLVMSGAALLNGYRAAAVPVPHPMRGAGTPAVESFTFTRLDGSTWTGDLPAVRERAVRVSGTHASPVPPAHRCGEHCAAGCINRERRTGSKVRPEPTGSVMSSGRYPSRVRAGTPDRSAVMVYAAGSPVARPGRAPVTLPTVELETRAPWPVGELVRTADGWASIPPRTGETHRLELVTDAPAPNRFGQGGTTDRAPVIGKGALLRITASRTRKGERAPRIVRRMPRADVLAAIVRRDPAAVAVLAVQVPETVRARKAARIASGAAVPRKTTGRFGCQRCGRVIGKGEAPSAHACTIPDALKGGAVWAAVTGR